VIVIEWLQVLWTHASSSALHARLRDAVRVCGYSTSLASRLAALSVQQPADIGDADHAQWHLLLVHDVDVMHARLGQPAYVGLDSLPALTGLLA
jgi:hypothetical protein